MDPNTFETTNLSFAGAIPIHLPPRYTARLLRDLRAELRRREGLDAAGRVA